MPAWLCRCGSWATAWADRPSITCPACHHVDWQEASPSMGGPTLARLASLMADLVQRPTCVASRLADGTAAEPAQVAHNPQQAPSHGRVQMRVGSGVPPAARPGEVLTPTYRTPGMAPNSRLAVQADVTWAEGAGMQAPSGRQAPIRPQRGQTQEQLIEQVTAEADRAATAGEPFTRPVDRPLTARERGLAIRQVWADAFPGRVNDGRRGCSVCGADETMVCDRTAHGQANAAAQARGEAPPSDDTAARYDKLELDGGPTKPQL